MVKSHSDLLICNWIVRTVSLNCLTVEIVQKNENYFISVYFVAFCLWPIRRLGRNWSYHAKCTRLYAFRYEYGMCFESGNSQITNSTNNNSEYPNWSIASERMKIAERERERAEDEQKRNTETVNVPCIFNVRFDHICWFYCIVMFLFRYVYQQRDLVLTSCRPYDIV